jgi:hypothetical protein
LYSRKTPKNWSAVKGKRIDGDCSDYDKTVPIGGSSAMRRSDTPLSNEDDPVPLGASVNPVARATGAEPTSSNRSPQTEPRPADATGASLKLRRESGTMTAGPYEKQHSP